MKKLTNRFVLDGVTKKLTIEDICKEYNFTRDQFDKVFVKVFPDDNARSNILRKLEQNQKDRDRIENNLMKRSRKARKTEKVIILTETKSAKATEATKATKSVNSDKKQTEPIDLYAVKKQEVDDIKKGLKRLETRIKDLEKKEDSTIQDIAKLDEEIKKQAELLSNLRKEKRSKNASLRTFRGKIINVKDQITTCTSELKQAEENLKQMNMVDVLIYGNSDFDVLDTTKAPLFDPRKSDNFTTRVFNICRELAKKPSCKNLSPMDLMAIAVAIIIKEDNPERSIKFTFENENEGKLKDILKTLDK